MTTLLNISFDIFNEKIIKYILLVPKFTFDPVWTQYAWDIEKYHFNIF
jgi:hypothetical protein